MPLIIEVLVSMPSRSTMVPFHKAQEASGKSPAAVAGVATIPFEIATATRTIPKARIMLLPVGVNMFG
ncbi:hypothetical protein AB4156_41260, partial [Cupriavidus sp. 2MCAB6]|uniref:hypothetical protein n=1 Tax=Cupriavidus sp. 2MCAB6 TaxID=3232981 RepID=UPI003F90952E